MRENISGVGSRFIAGAIRESHIFHDKGDVLNITSPFPSQATLLGHGLWAPARSTACPAASNLRQKSPVPWAHSGCVSREFMS